MFVSFLFHLCLQARGQDAELTLVEMSTENLKHFAPLLPEHPEAHIKVVGVPSKLTPFPGAYFPIFS